MLKALTLRPFLNQGFRYYYGTSRVGNREVVGHGVNGQMVYKDDAHFPFPAIRYREPDKEYCALKQKELGDWKKLTCEEKKALYRASFCQTYAEFQHPTGSWKFVLGWALFFVSAGAWGTMFHHTYVIDELPIQLDEEHQKQVLRRMLDLHVNPIDGLSSMWDYENDRWKHTDSA